MDEDFTPRMGTFFILLGVGMSILCFASFLIIYSPDPQLHTSTTDLQKTSFAYLIGAIVALGLGAILRRKAPSPPPSGRFSGFKNLLNRRKKKDDKSKKK